MLPGLKARMADFEMRTRVGEIQNEIWRIWTATQQLSQTSRGTNLPVGTEIRKTRWIDVGRDDDFELGKGFERTHIKVCNKTGPDDPYASQSHNLEIVARLLIWRLLVSQHASDLPEQLILRSGEAPSQSVPR